MQITKKKPNFTVLPSERDRIKTLEMGFRTKRRDGKKYETVATTEYLSG